MRAVTWGCFTAILLAFTASAQTPDTIYYNAHVITLASNRPSAEAVASAVRSLLIEYDESRPGAQKAAHLH